MLRFCFTFILLIANAPIGHSQWTVLHPSVLDSSTKIYGYNCLFVNNDSGFILSDRGLNATTDGGETWKPQSSRLFGIDGPISFPNFNDGWITDNGPYYFYRTTDIGVNWVLDSNANPDLEKLSGTSNQSALYFQDSMIGWEGYQNFSIFATTDGGSSWQLRHLETDSVLDLSFFTVVQIAFCNSTLGVALVDNGNGATFVLRTIDAGKTWQNLSPNHYSAIADGKPVGLAYSDAQHAWLCTDENQIMLSTDSGLTWSGVDVPPISARFQSMSFADSNHGIIAAGDAGTVAIYTFNGGQSWRADTLSRYNFCSASYPDTSVAYVTSGYSLFRLSTADLAVQPSPQVSTTPSMEIEGGNLFITMPEGRGDRLQIVDILGREVLCGVIPSDGLLKLDVSTISSGVYFVTGGNWQIKFAKE